MEKLDVHSAEQKVLNDAVDVLREIQSISSRMPVSATEGVELLGRVRTAAMKKKAEAFIRSNGLPIDVVCLQANL